MEAHQEGLQHIQREAVRQGKVRQEHIERSYQYSQIHHSYSSRAGSPADKRYQRRRPHRFSGNNGRDTRPCHTGFPASTNQEFQLVFILGCPFS